MTKALFGTIAALLIAPSLMTAKIEDRFKRIDPIEKNAEDHSFGPIDFVYLINLDHRDDKLKNTLSKLEVYGINPYRFSAVNGKHLSYEELSDIGLKFKKWMTYSDPVRTFLPENNGTPIKVDSMEEGKTYFNSTMRREEIGCAMSHLSILQDAFDSGYDLIWVLEDDIIVKRDPSELISLIHKIDQKIGRENWDMLFTDQDHVNCHGDPVPCYQYVSRPNFKHPNPKQAKRIRNLDQDFVKKGGRFGMHSFIITRSGIKKFLDFIKKDGLFWPTDVEMIHPIGMNMYSLRKDIIGNDPHLISSSDIRKNPENNGSK